jgi:hypothetical protein
LLKRRKVEQPTEIDLREDASLERSAVAGPTDG